MELAKEGFSIFIIDKEEAESVRIKKEIEAKGVNCSFLTYDFGVLGSASEAESLKSALDSCLKGRDVAILINNVAEFQHQEFAKVTADTIFRASNVNCHGQAILTNHFLPKLMARSVRSAVISVGTNAAEPQNPRYKFALYGGDQKLQSHLVIWD